MHHGDETGTGTPQTSLTARLSRLVVVAASLLAVAAGFASCSADEADVSSAAQPGATVIGDLESSESATATPVPPTATPFVVATSTPLPTATPLPTEPPEPLATPTPATVLLTTAFTNHSKVTTTGIGSIQWGLTPEDAARRQETTWVGEAEGRACYPITPGNGPDGVTLWVAYGFLERVDVTHPDIRTRSGYGIGNTRAELEQQLGHKLSVVDNPDGTATATFTPDDDLERNYRLVFELDSDGLVTSLRSGHVEFIDGDKAC